MLFYRLNQYDGKKIGPYTIIKKVGEGRYGMCLLAHALDGTPVIIKRFKNKIFQRHIEKNENEAVILSQINHKSVPKFLGVINEKDFYGFILEQKPGETIEAMLFKNKHSFNDIEIFKIGSQLIGSIKYLHKKGIVHRDIRIPNVILNDQELYLLDFGLARWADNQRYRYDTDFSYLGDFLLYLIYSSYNSNIKMQKFKNKPWHKELPLPDEQKSFLKKLLRLEISFNNIDEIEVDFIKAFG